MLAKPQVEFILQGFVSGRGDQHLQKVTQATVGERT